MNRDRFLHVLYEPKAKQFLQTTFFSNKVERWLPDPDWEPEFVTIIDDNMFYLFQRYGMSEDQAKHQWAVYEFQRTEYRPDLPKLVVRRMREFVTIEHAGWVNTDITPMYRMVQRVRAKHGSVLADALDSVDQVKQPDYAIKRKGKTGESARSVLPDTIVHQGMYMFFYSEDDLALAKIMLGPNLAQQYDLRPFHAC